MSGPSVSAETMLQVEGLEVSYGAVKALRGIDMRVGRGKIVTLIGCNGAGKTTLLRSISGLIAATTGSIQFEGLELHQTAAHTIVAAGLSHVPEGRLVFAELTVKENLELGAFLRRDDLEPDLDRVYRLFPKMRERTRQMAGTLSGGEQQMLAIGRALMSRPKMLLMDEPSLGLAPRLVRSIFDTIREINQAGTTILLVEQNANLALAVADHAYVLETGEIVLQGPAADLAKDESVRKAYLGE